MRWLILAAWLLATPALAKLIEIRWPEVPFAAGYQIEIRRGERVIQTKSVDAPTRQWRVKLSPGVYTYRVRAIDAVERPGAWSPVSRLIALPPAPGLLAPADRVVIPSGQAVTIRWTKLKIATFSLLIRRDGREIARETITGERFEFHPPEPGTYEVEVAGVLRDDPRAQRSGPASAARVFIVGAPPEAPVTRVVAKLRDLASTPEPTTVGDWVAHNHGSVHLASAYLPYHYAIDSGTSQARLATSASAMEIVTGGEGWFTEHFGLGGYFDSRVFEMGGRKGSAHRLQALALYRRYLPGRWGVLRGGAGLAIRDYVQTRPDNDQDADIVQDFDSLSLLGADLALQWTLPFSHAWALTLDTDAFLPLTETGDHQRLVDGPFRYPNLQAGLGAHYQFLPHWQASATLAYEIQQTRFQTTDSYNPALAIDKIHFDFWSTALKITRLF